MPPRTLPDALAAAAATGSGYTFVAGQAEVRKSYRAIFEAALGVAESLHHAGLRRGDVVGLLVGDAEPFLTLLFGASLAGVIPASLYPPPGGDLSTYVETATAILNAAQARAVVTSASHVDGLTPLRAACPRLDLVLSRDDLAGPPRDSRHRPSLDDVALIQFTSGSTSSPKGVVLTHGSLCANIDAINGPGGLGTTEADSAVSWLPLYHDMGLVGMALGPLYSGRPGVFLATQAFVKRPADWLRAISRHRATVSFAPSFAYDLCLRRVKDRDLDGLDLSCWRVAGCGAEPIHAAALAAFAARFAPCGFRETSFLPGYGLAEHTVAATFAPRGRPLRVERVAPGSLSERGEAVLAADDEPSAVHVVCCGAALPGHELRVVDEAGCALGERQVGEIVLSGPSVMLGYHNEPELTRHTIRDGWLWTGDLGYVADGELFVCGRLKDLIIVGGRKFHPQDLEWAVDELPGIRGGRVAAFGAAHGGRERVVMVVEPNGTVPSDRLVEAVRRRVADLMGLYVDDVVLVPSGTVGRTTSGKVQRANAKARYERGELELAGEVKGARGGPPPRAAPSPRR
jgi:fatty-acyl-CoA synthase